MALQLEAELLLQAKLVLVVVSAGDPVGRHLVRRSVAPVPICQRLALLQLDAPALMDLGDPAAEAQEAPLGEQFGREQVVLDGVEHAGPDRLEQGTLY